MVAILLGLVTTYAGSLGLGAVTATVVEAAIPWLTAAQRARRAVALARKLSRQFHGRDLTPQEMQTVEFDARRTI